MNTIKSYIEFVKELEHIKTVLRTAWTSDGTQESTAAHSWRLAVFAGIMLDQFPELDGKKILMMALIHDLGEIYDGDISAALLPDPNKKFEMESASVTKLFSILDAPERSKLYDLWSEYEGGLTPEAKLVKALDKAETIIQHNQGRNPENFDYSFNLTYGEQYFKDNPILSELRAELDKDTIKRVEPQEESLNG